MICWIFAAIAIGAAGTATVMENMRRAAIALWIAGCAVGGIFLTLGVETLAIVQWILATLSAISFIFFSVMFGEDGETAKVPDRKKLIGYGIAAVIGICFAGVIYFGAGNFEVDLSLPSQGNDLYSLGKVLTDHHLLALEVLALTLLLVLVGGGSVARPETGNGDSQC
jgi:NADH:ubiquinone oxidoreductase subunit 6 (subunit J)